MIDALTRLCQPAAARRCGRLLPWLMALVFLLQILGTAEHHHELHAKTPHCVSCTLHAQPHAAPPPTTLAPVTSGWALVHALVYAQASGAAPAAPPFLLPPAQGPPAFLQT